MAKYNGPFHELCGKHFKTEKMVDSIRGDLIKLELAAEHILESLEDSKKQIDVKKVEEAEQSTKNLLERICYLKGLYS